MPRVRCSGMSDCQRHRDGPAPSLNDAVESLVRKVTGWRGEDHLRDDVSILAIAVE